MSEEVEPHDREFNEASNKPEAESKRRHWVKIILPLGLVVLGVGLAAFLFVIRPKPEKEAPEEKVTAVTTMPIVWRDHRAHIHARGRVRAARRVSLVPHVAGPVTWVSERLIPGGHFERGEALLRVDPTDYRLAAEVQRAEVRRAEVELRREQNRKQVSERGWELYQSSRERQSAAVDRPFVLNEPQLAAAEQSLQSAESRLKQAKVDLSRTLLTAPFDAEVLSKQVEAGQRVSPQNPVVTLVGTEAFWVQAAIDVDDVLLIELPQARGEERGSQVTVSYTVQGQTATRDGYVLRLLSELDPEGTMARLLIEVPDPLDLAGEHRGPPLLIGAFVDVDIEGKMLSDVVVAPSRAVHEDDQVWLLGEERRLAMRQVEVVRRQGDRVLIRGDLPPEAKLITNNIPLPVEGMLLKESAESANAQNEALPAEGPAQ